jgi:5,6-dimethylbenzimidazole synthase
MDLYEAIFKRRDIRAFRPDPLPDEALSRILDAAHHAGSVGFMQPWNFILVRAPGLRTRVKESFDATTGRLPSNTAASRRPCTSP